MNEQTKINRALLIAPLTAPILYFLGAILFNVDGKLKADDIVPLVMVLILIAAPVSYIATAILGIPYYYLLKKRNWVTGLNLVIGGVILGVVAFLLFWASPFGLGILVAFDGAELAIVSAIGAALGGGVAWCFYILSGIREQLF